MDNTNCILKYSNKDEIFIKEENSEYYYKCVPGSYNLNIYYKYTGDKEILLDCIKNIEITEKTRPNEDGTFEEYLQDVLNIAYTNKFYFPIPVDIAFTFEVIQCNKGKIKCPKCGHKKEMYYAPRCFNCEQPKVKTFKVVNLYEACRYLENQYRLKQRSIYDKISDEFEYDNDSYTKLYLDDNSDDMIKLLNQHYNFEEYLFEISW